MTKLFRKEGLRIVFRRTLEKKDIDKHELHSLSEERIISWRGDVESESKAYNFGSNITIAYNKYFIGF
jgi:hypothetical protein